MDTIKIGDIVKVSPDYIDEYSQILWYEDFNADTCGTVRKIEPNGKWVLVRWDIEVNACVDLDIQTENLILVFEPKSDLQFVPCWSRDNYGKYPHEGTVVPLGEDVNICQFTSHGSVFTVSGNVSPENIVRVWAESSKRGETPVLFDEDFYEDLGDVFDIIVMHLYTAGIDVQEDVTWFSDWCESQSTVTGELGAGLFIHNFTEEHGFPYGCGFEGCNDLRQDKDKDSDSDFENEGWDQDYIGKPGDVIVNIFM